MSSSRIRFLLILVGLTFSNCDRPNLPPARPPLSLKIEKPEIGKVVSDFSLSDSNGRLFRLSDFRGNVVFLNFWATWCPPCVQEFPYMDAMNQRFKAKNFTMIAVSVDKTWSDIFSFYSNLRHEPSFLVLLDPSRVVSSGFGTVQYPETYVIDPKGRLVKKYIGALNWLDPTVLNEWDSFIQKTE